MKKILFCNLDLLVKKFQELDPENSLKNRNEFLEYIDILCEDNEVLNNLGLIEPSVRHG